MPKAKSEGGTKKKELPELQNKQDLDIQSALPPTRSHDKCKRLYIAMFTDHSIAGSVEHRSIPLERFVNSRVRFFKWIVTNV
jgi:hypothetical protein